MIKVNVAIISPDGMEVSGTEDAAFLDLENTEGIPVSVHGPVRYNLHAAMVGEDLLVTGSAFAELATKCSLCLKDVVQKIGSDKICIHKEKVPEDIIDLTEDVREEILLSVPSRFKCSEDCKGLCPGCGADLNSERCKCRKKKTQEPKKDDHTWDALDNLKL